MKELYAEYVKAYGAMSDSHTAQVYATRDWHLRRVYEQLFEPVEGKERGFAIEEDKKWSHINQESKRLKLEANAIYMKLKEYHHEEVMLG